MVKIELTIYCWCTESVSSGRAMEKNENGHYKCSRCDREVSLEIEGIE